MLIIYFISGGSRVLDGDSFEQEKGVKEKIEVLLLNDSNYRKIIKFKGTTVGNVGSIKKVEVKEKRYDQTSKGPFDGPFNKDFNIADALKEMLGGNNPFGF